MQTYNDKEPLITVVLTTYNRAGIIPQTLAHIERQDLPPGQFELVVSDDGSSDNTSDIITEFAARAPFTVRYLRHTNTGVGYAENRGIEAARAPLVLLLADDIFLSPPAVRKHLEFHQAHPEAGIAVLGRIQQSPDLNQSAFLRKWDPFRFNELEDLKELPPYRFGAANLSLKRDFLLQHGLFLEHKGRAGAACMEDLELGYRLQPHGMRLHYSKDAFALHYHLTTLDTAMLRWYERGLNYGEFRRHAPAPELTVYFHVLNSRTVGEYRRVLKGPNPFHGSERSMAWHVVRHIGRIATLNSLTTKVFWRPLFNLAERSPFVESLVTAKMYRAFLYHQFLRGVAEGHRRYGD